MKKNTGNRGLYQNGCSLFGMIRYKVPSEDWCKRGKQHAQDHEDDHQAAHDLSAFCS